MAVLTRKAVQPLIRLALREDQAFRDITSSRVLPSGARVRARIVAKSSGILAGGPIASWTFFARDASLHCVVKCREGAYVANGRTLLTVEGAAHSIFAAERVVLNLLGHLSGIATLTQAFVQRIRGSHAKIFDTRKTLPGLRVLEKYAIRAGGGSNHRMDLSEAILIKTNHLKALTTISLSDKWQVTSGKLIQDAVVRAKQMKPRRFIEIEVANLREFKAALQGHPDAILLDNWHIQNIHKAVAMIRRHQPLLEVSGGVTLANVRAIAKTGVDRISIGCLTHSAPALDVALQVMTHGTFPARH